MDGSVVVAAHTEGVLSECAALFEFGLCSVALHDVEKHRIFGLAWYNHHILEILCSGTDK